MYLSQKSIFSATALAMLVLVCGTASAQSGRSVMNGYVAFENIAYVDKQPRAKVALCSAANKRDCGISVETNEHGLYEINPAPLGEWWLRISAPGFITYEIPIFLPSDFIGNLAVRLKPIVKQNGQKKSGHRSLQH